MDAPETYYARSGDVSIAYQVVGSGPVDLVLVRGTLSDLTTIWEQPLLVRFLEGLASFARLVVFDKRDDEFKRWFVRHMRQSASPGAAVAFQRMVMDGDVTDVLPAVRTPTLVLSRAASADPADYLASRIPGAVREIPGLVDGYSWVDPAANEFVVREAEEFLRHRGASAEPERVLATFLFTDIVRSTERAAALGDAAWKSVLARHDALVRQRLARHRGRSSTRPATASSPPSTGPAGRFAARGRS